MPFTILDILTLRVGKLCEYGDFCLNDWNEFTSDLLMYIISILGVFQEIGTDRLHNLEIQESSW